ncbi:MAG: hypothetical protein ABEN55_08685 [Bradymonadaceae bacterium]
MLDAYIAAADMSLTHASAFILMTLPVILIVVSGGVYRFVEASAAYIRQTDWRRMIADTAHVRLAKQYTTHNTYTKGIAHAIAAVRLADYPTAENWIESVRYWDVRTVASYTPLIALLAVVAGGCGAKAVTLLSAAAAVAPLGHYAYTPRDKSDRRDELTADAESIGPEFTPAELRNGNALEQVVMECTASGRSELGMQLCRLVRRLRNGANISRELYHLATTYDWLGPRIFPTYLALQ